MVVTGALMMGAVLIGALIIGAAIVEIGAAIVVTGALMIGAAPYVLIGALRDEVPISGEEAIVEVPIMEVIGAAIGYTIVVTECERN